MEIKNHFFSRSCFMLNFWLCCLVLFFYHLSALPQVFSEESKRIAGGQITARSEKIDNFRDPFQPQIVMPKEKPAMEEKVEAVISRAQELFSLSIQGIIWGSEIPMAIINNQVLREGQTISLPKVEGGTEEVGIIDIEKDGVTITYSGGIEKLNYSGLDSQVK